MIDESKYELPMQIIMHAGNAKSAALMAIDSASEGAFEEADAHLKEAQGEMVKAHDVQFGMIQQEASGNSVELNIILVHAQDHLTMAVMMSDIAERMVDLYRRLAA